MLCDVVIKKFQIADKVNIALNGIQALETIQNSTEIPELILIDVHMPFMNGYEFLEAFEKMKLNNKDFTSLAMISASPIEKGFEELTKKNVAELMAKPITSKKMRSIINKHRNKMQLSIQF